MYNVRDAMYNVVWSHMRDSVYTAEVSYREKTNISN